MKKILFLFAAALCGLTANAQMGGGANIGFWKYPGTSSSMLSYGLHAGYCGYGNGSAGIRLSFQTGKDEFDESMTATALSNFTSPSSITVKGTGKLRLTTLEFNYFYFFGEKDYETGGLYVIGGVALGLGSVKYEMNSYDKTKYTLNNQEMDASASQLFLRLGGGYMHTFENGIGISAEPYILLPSRNSRDESSVSITRSFGLTFGISKFIL